MKKSFLIQIAGVIYFGLGLVVYLKLVGLLGLQESFWKYAVLGLLVWPLPYFWKKARELSEKGK